MNLKGTSRLRKLFCFLIVMSVTAGVRADLNDGLVARYPFNGNAEDTSGNGNTGSVVGATFEPFGSNNKLALACNGTAATYVVVPESSSLEPTNGISISFWCNGIPGSIGYGTILRKADNCGAGYYIRAADNSGTNNTPTFRIDPADPCGPPNSAILPFLPCTGTNWQQFVATYSVADGLMKTYFDGVLVNQLAYSNELQNSGDLYIGGATVHPQDGGFAGLISDLRIYNRELAPTEVQELFLWSQQAYVSAGRILVLTSASISATDLGGSTNYWTWTYPQAANSPWAQVLPDGNGGYRVLVRVDTTTSPNPPTTFCLNGDDGKLQWQVQGEPAQENENSVLTHNIYTDPDLFPDGPPHVGWCGSPAVLINHRADQWGGTNSQVFCIDSGTGRTNWIYQTASGTHWASGWVPDVDGDGGYDFIVRSITWEGSAGLWCISGRDGATQIWSRPDVSRGGVTIGDVTGDGIADYAIGECCYDDRVYTLNGTNGSNVWAPEDFGSFDLQGIKRVSGYSDFVVAAQLSSSGGVKRYHGADGSTMWTCSPTYYNCEMQGLIPVPSGYYVLAGWRDQGKAICFDANTGSNIWDNVPANEADYVGIVVPDQDEDGYEDLLIINNGAVALYNSESGVKIRDLSSLTGVVNLAYLPARGASLQGPWRGYGKPCGQQSPWSQQPPRIQQPPCGPLPPWGQQPPPVQQPPPAQQPPLGQHPPCGQQPH